MSRLSPLRNASADPPRRGPRAREFNHELLLVCPAKFASSGRSTPGRWCAKNLYQATACNPFTARPREKLDNHQESTRSQATVIWRAKGEGTYSYVAGGD